MYTFLVILVLLACVLLVLAVLAQNSKGGVGSALGGSSSQLMGVKRTGDILEKVTWGLVIFIFAATVGTSMVSDSSDGVVNSINVEEAQKAAPVQQPKPAAGQAQPAAE